jgi:hypothetical protein
MLTSHDRRLPIEKLALLTESAPELGAKLDEWHDFYKPATPGERELMDTAVMASVQKRRVLACLTEMANQQVRTAVFQYDCDQEDEVERYRQLLETQPGVAVVGLKRSALGVRLLIERWERLLRLLHEEGTWYGNDRKEAIQYQGARATEPENLFESEGAYLTWLYCLMCQPDPKEEDFLALGNERWMPTALNDRKAEHWLGHKALCRKLLEELAEGELAHLRKREALLRIHYETPARQGAEVRKQVLQSPEGARLQREAESHDRQYHRAYQAFLKGRAQSIKTGTLPGAPQEDLHGGSVETTTTAVAPEPAGLSAEAMQEQRMEGADALAPGGANGIGPPHVRGDAYRAAVMAAGPLSPAELRERMRARAAAAEAGIPGG